MIDDLFDDGDPLMDAPSRSPRSDGKNFIGCPIPWLLRVSPVVKTSKQLIVAIYVWKRYVAEGYCKTFSMPNGGLKQLGISRHTKYRTLKLLASAGIITMKKAGKETFSITILPEKPKGRTKKRRSATG